MKAIKWTIPFASLKGKNYTINIYADGYSGTPITLTGAPEPIVTEEDDDEDPFMPIRDTTGHIRIMVTNPSNVADIHPTGIKDRYVELVEGSNNVVWMGYVQRGTYSTAWDAVPYELELPIISAIGILKEVEYSETPAKVDLGVLLEQIIKKTDAPFECVYIPTHLTTADLQVDISNLAFMPTEAEEKEYYIGSDIPEPGFQMSWYEVLEELAKYLGFQVREYKKDVVFCTADETDTYYRIDVDDLSFGTLSPSDIVSVDDESLPPVAGEGGTISRLLPVQQVRISTPLDEIVDEFANIGLLKYLTYRESFEDRRIDEGIEMSYYRADALINDDLHVIAYRGMNSQSQSTSPSAGPFSLVHYNWGARSFNDSLTGMTYIGGSLACDTFTEGAATVPTIIISPSSQSNTKAVEIITNNIIGQSSNIEKLKLRIVTKLVSFNDWQTMFDAPYPQIGVYIKCTSPNGLNWKYYGGAIDGWSESETLILLSFTNNTDIEANLTFPLCDIDGKYSITLCCFNNAFNNNRTLGNSLKFLRITEFEFGYSPTPEQKSVEDKYNLDSIERVMLTGADGTDMYQQEQLLFTNVNLLTEFPNYKVPFTYYGIEGNSHWSDILTRMKNWYCVPRYCIEVDTHPDDEVILNPASRIYNGSTSYILCAQMINWRDDINNIKIISK